MIRERTAINNKSYKHTQVVDNIDHLFLKNPLEIRNEKMMRSMKR
jgi:hypothetical protein